MTRFSSPSRRAHGGSWLYTQKGARISRSDACQVASSYADFGFRLSRRSPCIC
jgi:hypothetical protein